MSSIDPSGIARQLILVALLLGVVCPQVGCVALNIPSERLHDATDHGGMFGDWRKHRHIADNSHFGSPNHHELHAHHGIHVNSGRDDLHCVDGNCESGAQEALYAFDGGPLESDPFGPDPNAAVQEPEIPWPRFHPIPTRPVFGPTSP